MKVVLVLIIISVLFSLLDFKNNEVITIPKFIYENLKIIFFGIYIFLVTFVLSILSVLYMQFENEKVSNKTNELLYYNIMTYAKRILDFVSDNFLNINFGVFCFIVIVIFVKSFIKKLYEDDENESTK